MRAAHAVPLVLLLILLPACKRTEQAAPPGPAYDWALDPAVPGDDLPPTGASLFDSLTNDPLPFPFPKLLEQIATRIGAPVQLDRVLIPLGRSLQRSAAAPEFFKFPRAVVAFGADPTTAVVVKDRLFMGYQEKAGVIEVLSYNEEAGRFEFQLVKDYRPGATPRVFYARRHVCTVCHQNQAPLFPRQLWDETNANPRVSRLLMEEGRDYYGFPVAESADTPYRIDLSIHRANEFSAYQFLWSESDAGARAALMKAVLRCRLSGACDGSEAIAVLAPRWRERWPAGIAIPNPEIANRNPLAILSREGPPGRAETLAFLAERQKSIGSQFEPGMRRAPLEHWAGDAEHIERVVTGMAAFFPRQGIAVLNRELGALDTPAITYHARCSSERATDGLVLNCTPVGHSGFAMNAQLSARGRSGSVARLAVGAARPVRNVTVSGAVPGSLVVEARSGDGNRIRSIRIAGDHSELITGSDFAIAAAALDRLAGDPSSALSAPRFRASAILREVVGSISRTAAAEECCAAPAAATRKQEVEN